MFQGDSTRSLFIISVGYHFVPIIGTRTFEFFINIYSETGLPSVVRDWLIATNLMIKQVVLFATLKVQKEINYC